MDGTRFDALTRTLTATISRRVTLSGLAAGVLVALGLALDETTGLGKNKNNKGNSKGNGKGNGNGNGNRKGNDNNKKKQSCPPCKKKKDGKCKGKKPDGTACENRGQCQNGSCIPVVQAAPLPPPSSDAAPPPPPPAPPPPPPPPPPGSTCTDGVQNGTETDVDCGGSCATKCAVGKRCAIASDCTTGTCLQGICRRRCEIDDECPAGTVCVQTVCRTPEICQFVNDPCGAGFTCGTEATAGCFCRRTTEDEAVCGRVIAESGCSDPNNPACTSSAQCQAAHGPGTFCLGGTNPDTGGGCNCGSCVRQCT